MSVSSDHTSPTLLARVQGFDAESWRRLVDLYGPLVYRWQRRWGAPPADAEDLVQEVFQRVAGGVARFRRADGGSFRGWLWRIARNAAHDYFARRGPAQGTGGTTMHVQLQRLPDPQPSEDGEGDGPPPDDRTRLLHAALAVIRGDFQPATWQAFWRSAVEGQETAAIARELGMTARAVRQAKHRVLTRLRQEFGDLLE